MMLRARYVVPIDRPVIEDGAVVIAQGVIQAVGPASERQDDDVTDFQDAVILPGLVNAHTHLELGDLANQIPPTNDFCAWLERLMEALSSHPPTLERVTATVRAGVIKSLASGVTLVGDITSHPKWTRPALAKSDLRAVSFGEVIAIGNRRHLLTERLDAAASLEHECDRVRVGISPHSPYTMEPDGLRACAAKAEQLTAPLCIHLAETRYESQFTEDGSGPLADYLHRIGVWDDGIPTSGCSPVELANSAGLLGSRTVLAHANYVSDDDISTMARAGVSVAYCPRTHAAFGHVAHRFGDMLAAGVNVCLGTDSLASNPSLSILDELRFLRSTQPDVSPTDLIRMATIRGARALGLDRLIGSICPGKSADLVVLPLEPCADHRAWDDVLRTESTPIEVYLSGVRVSDSAASGRMSDH